ncbi:MULTISPECIES: hypothetical protein [Xenorhabdus]|uniref:hypothetical protein n=1 Tax=Xenorhabdus TaxID=626 RepID=UPI0012DDC228|nr:MULTISPECIES: hypothetical protein [Xenorhabdus]MDE9482530.1 hypothetical protein [Xenorhabdus bovienii]
MRWRNKAPVACKGAHYPVVHLRTFGSRYRQTITRRPTMKVIRCDSHRLIMQYEQRRLCVVPNTDDKRPECCAASLA